MKQFTCKNYMVNHIEGLTEVNQYTSDKSIRLQWHVYAICEVN